MDTQEPEDWSSSDVGDSASEQDYKQDEQDIRNSKARKRIDDLLEQKRLKDLLDDSLDWDI